MRSLRPSRSSVADWDRFRFVGVVGGLVLFGLTVQVVLSTRATTWAGELELVLALVPVLVGILTYVHSRPSTAGWEIGAVAAWGVLAQYVALLVIFVVGPRLAGSISISGAVLSGSAQLQLADTLWFLGTVAVFVGCYTAAADHRDRPAVSAVALLAVPVLLLVGFAVM